jgi:hypothetical protein
MTGLHQIGEPAGAAGLVTSAHVADRGARRRGVILAVVVTAAAIFASGQAELEPARAASGPAAALQGRPATCVIHSLPAFVAQGENIDGRNAAATVADVVDVECDPTVYGTKSRMKLLASQLYTRCAGHLTWYVPNNPPGEGIPGGYEVIAGRGVTVNLDADGSAIVALRAGPDCAAGESLIIAHMEETPFESFTTSFVVLPPQTTPPGVYALPSTEVEDSYSSAVATVIEAEFEDGSEKFVRIASEELYRRCRAAPHIHWILMDGTEAPAVPEVTGVRLDNDGNAFVIAIGDASCAPGSSLIEADLESKPFTTFTTNFTIFPPQPTAEPAFSIEKLQEIGGGGKGFTTAPLTGALGQTVHYQIAVKNTGRVGETFSDFADPHCDPGTIAGGPGSSPVAPGEATTFTCSHVLTAVGTYNNQAIVTAHTIGGAPLTQASNEVVVNVPAEPAFTIEKLQQVGSSAFTSLALMGAIGQTVEYQIIVKNTGNVSLVFGGLADPHCDAGTISGGPGSGPVAPGETTTFTCRHVLASPGTYVNEASLSGSPEGQAPMTHTSNQVEVIVPSQAAPSVIRGGNEGQVPPIIHVGPNEVPCVLPRPVWRGASGSKRSTFTLQLSSIGVKRVTFYLDGRKLKTMEHSQARRGMFTVRIDPRRLSYGPHRVSLKTVMTDRRCARIARTGVFVRPRPPAPPQFAG